MVVGFLTFIIWDNFIDIEIYPLVPGFIFAMLAIILFSILSNNKKTDIK
jgi:sodium/proline symporter